ncbi:MAG: Hsp20/alpha crystallin family protein [Thermodesulfobacteriota bacterium]
MALVKKGPFGDFISLQERMSRIFDEALSRYRGLQEGGVWSPLADIYEAEDTVVLRVELPGVVDVKDVDVELKENVLTLSGERKIARNPDEEHFYRMECSYGAFQRVFTLPEAVDKSGINAALIDGVLEIRLSKAKKTRSKKVEVEGK